ncbi:TPR repeat-containing protein YrrB [Phycisphaerae bacterium RAS2]|nr:TPR repeat-containing protein YrrB [Phycisphaerae bacterium RAS2]
MPLLVIAVGIAAYWNSFAGVFIFDDEHAIVRNRYIKSLWPLTDAMSAPPQSSVSGRPIVALTLAVNYALGGLNPWGYHLFNLVVHLFTGLALYGVALETFRRGENESGNETKYGIKLKGTGNSEQSTERFEASRRTEHWPLTPDHSPVLAGIVAMIWLVHPLQTESVTYIIQRAEAVMGLFYFATLYFAIRAMATSRPIGWQLAAVLACALGMASKEVMATAPILVALYDRVFVSSTWREVFARRKGFYAALFGTWIILGAIVAGAPRSDSAGFGLTEMTPVTYMLMQFNAVLLYLRLSFWPATLCLDYWAPPIDSRGEALAQGALIAVLLAGTFWLLARRPRIGYWCFWTFAVLAPTSTFIPIADPIFEHRMYVPLAGLVMAAVACCHGWFRRLPTSQARTVGLALAVVTILALTARTVARNRDYHDAKVMWEKVLAYRPRNPRAWANLSEIHLQRGDPAAALAACERAFEVAPHYHDAYKHLARSLVEMGRVPEAIETYQRALRDKPGDYQVLTNLGEALVRVGRNEEALDAFKKAIVANGAEPLPHFNLGRTLQMLGRAGECIEPYRACLAIEPDHRDALANLAAALGAVGKLDESEAQFAELLRRFPDDAAILYSRAVARARGGKRDAAMEDYRRVVALDAKHADARCNLGVLLKDAGRTDEAIAMFQSAIAADARHVPSLYNLGATYATLQRYADAVAAFDAALKIDPNHPPSRQALAATRALMNAGKPGG